MYKKHKRSVAELIASIIQLQPNSIYIFLTQYLRTELIYAHVCLRRLRYVSRQITLLSLLTFIISVFTFCRYSILVRVVTLVTRKDISLIVLVRDHDDRRTIDILIINY